jgi:uncharacterized surface protein with fasciclin (FAS1) repeats
MKRIGLNKQGIKRHVLAVALLAGLGSALALETNEDITILQGLQEDENFTMLVSLLESSGLAEDLSAAGDITLFAPTNEAFDALDADTLTSLSEDSAALTGILQLHVVAGEYPVLDLDKAEEGSLSNLLGEPVVVEQSASGLTVNDADLVATDVDNFYSNGVVHVVSEVLLPAATAIGDETTTDDATTATTDVNGDGVIDDADMMTDTNGDGVMDMNDVADSNNDGVIDEADYMAAGLTDVNNDGVVDDQDMTDMAATTDTTTDTATTATDDATDTESTTMTMTDTNADGTIDVADVTDMNEDGVVDELDYTAVGMTDTNNDGVIDENDTMMAGEMAMGKASTMLVSDSDDDSQNNCEDNDDMIDSDGDGTDADQCNAATQ